MSTSTKSKPKPKLIVKSKIVALYYTGKAKLKSKTFTQALKLKDLAIAIPVLSSFKSTHPAFKCLKHQTLLRPLPLAPEPLEINLSTYPANSIKVRLDAIHKRSFAFSPVPFTAQLQPLSKPAVFHLQSNTGAALFLYSTIPTHAMVGHAKSWFTNPNIEVWWSDNPCISSQDYYNSNYYVSTGASTKLIINSKGELTEGHFLTDVTLLSPDPLPFKPHSFTIPNMLKLYEWHQAGTLHSIMDLFHLKDSKGNSIIDQEDSPFPHYLTDFLKSNLCIKSNYFDSKEDAYTNLSLEEILVSQEFADSIVKSGPDITALFLSLQNKELIPLITNNIALSLLKQ